MRYKFDVFVYTVITVAIVVGVISTCNAFRF